jgi:hypothetical protein
MKTHRFLNPWLAAIATITLSLSGVSAVHAADLTAREIMQKVKDRDDGNNSISDMEMILIDSKDQQRVRSMRSFRRDSPANKEDGQSIMFFLAPADVKDTGFLTFDYDDASKDDDQWLYLPALKKVKRIAASDKSSSFMGSDFTYADMSSPNIDDYTYSIMKEEMVNGQKTWQIESVPKTEAEIERTGYTKSVLFVRQDNFVPVRAVNWVKKGDRLKYMEVKKLEQIDDIWTSTEITMATKKGNQTLHRSIIKVSNTKYNQKLEDELFSERRLEKGL